TVPLCSLTASCSIRSRRWRPGKMRWRKIINRWFNSTSKRDTTITRRRARDLGLQHIKIEVLTQCLYRAITAQLDRMQESRNPTGANNIKYVTAQINIKERKNIITPGEL